MVQNLTFKIIRRMRSLIFNQNHEEKRLQNIHPWASRRWEKWLVRRSQILVETHTGSDPPLPGAPARVKDCYNVTSPRVTCHVSRALTNRLLWPEDFSCHKKLFIIELVTRAFLRTCVSGSGDYQILKRFVFRMRVWHLSSFGRGKYPQYLSSVLVVSSLALLKHPFNNSISFVMCFLEMLLKATS